MRWSPRFTRSPVVILAAFVITVVNLAWWGIVNVPQHALAACLLFLASASFYLLALTVLVYGMETKQFWYLLPSIVAFVLGLLLNNTLWEVVK